MSDTTNRRDFIKTAAAAGIGIVLTSSMEKSAQAQAVPDATAAPAPAAAPGPASKVVTAVCGTNGRGLAHVQCLTMTPGVEIAYICDVDDRAIAKGIRVATQRQKNPPTGLKDFRKMLDDKSVDAITIATPDHWHTPMAILALAAGKHVYVEKPLSQNPYEGELLIQAAAAKPKQVVQMGAQRRSIPNLQAAIKAIHDGIIGKTYFGQAWYTNRRGSIGHGKQVAVPAWLDYELWQGPAPRRPYQDNLLHYNWHWFWNYGTGEALNNGTHEVDVCRWALGVDFAKRATSIGGRYQFQDDWETPDTQVIGWDFPEGKSLSWEGRSCNDFPIDSMARGAMVFGTDGSALLDGGNCTIYNKKNIVTKQWKDSGPPIDPTNVISTSISMDQAHVQNFIDCVRSGATPNCPVTEGHRSVLLLHLGNIAWRTGHELNCDPTNGHILNDADAMKLWQRTYEPGWEPKV